MYLKILISLFLITFNAFSQNRHLNTNPISLDAHAHFFSQEPAVLTSYLKGMEKYNIQHAFALSLGYQAYLLNIKPNDMSTVEHDKIIHDFVVKENNYTAALVKRYPRKFNGFCSVPWKWKHTFTEYSRCIKMGLKGIKLHIWDWSVLKPGDDSLKGLPVNLEDRDDLLHFRSIIEFADKNHQVVGMHSNQMSDREIFNALFTVASNRRNLKFIFLHGLGLTSSSIVTYMNTIGYWETFAIDLSGVVYLELSYNPFLINKRPSNFKKNWIKNLKTYSDLPHLLFGSDSYSSNTNGPPAIELNLKAYKKILTAREEKLVFEKNGSALVGSLEGINPSRRVSLQTLKMSSKKTKAREKKFLKSLTKYYRHFKKRN